MNDAIKNWIDNSTERICAIYGAPGGGKSAFMAHYMHFNSQVAGGVFCERGLRNLNDARTVICTLAFLRACRLSNFRVLLLESLAKRNNWELLSAEEMFQIIFEECLSHSIDGGQETLLLVIDGVDECGAENGRWLITTLLKYASRLPEWLRFIITSRKEYYVKEPLKNCFSIDIDKMPKENSEDVGLYLHKKLAYTDLTETEIAYLIEKSEGIFQYAEIIAELINNKKIVVSDIEKLPSGLDDIFYLWFSAHFDNDQEYEKISHAIDIILTVPEPISEIELKKIMNWKQRDLSSFKRAISAFLVTEKSIYDNELADTLDISSSYLKMWLANDCVSERYAAYPDDGKELLAEYYLKGIQTETLSNYGLLYGIKIACEQYPEYREIVSHSRYVFERIKEFFKTTDKQYHYGKFCDSLFELFSALHESGSLEAFVNEDISNDDGNMALVAGILYLIREKPTIAVGYWKILIDLWENWIKHGEILDDEDWITYAVMLHNMASSCRDIYDDVQAEKYYLQEIEVLRRFEKSESAEKASVLASCYFGFAGFITQRSNMLNDEYYCNMAKRMYRRAVRIYKKLVETNPEEYAVLLADTYSDLACFLARVDEWDSTQNYFRYAHEILEELFQRDKKRYEIEFAILKGAMGFEYDYHHNRREAIKLYKDAEILIEAHSVSLSIKEKGKVAIFYNNYASGLEELQSDDKKAKDLKQKSLYLQKDLIDNDFLLNCVNYLASSSSYAVQVAEKGNNEDAEFWLKETLQTAERVQGVNRNLDAVLASSYINAGTAYFILGNRKMKKMCHRKAMEICNRHSEKIFIKLANRLRLDRIK